MIPATEIVSRAQRAIETSQSAAASSRQRIAAMLQQRQDAVHMGSDIEDLATCDGAIEVYSTTLAIAAENVDDPFMPVYEAMVEVLANEPAHTTTPLRQWRRQGMREAARVVLDWLK